MVWVVTWLSVVVLNVDLGLAIGVVFSMMTVICRTQRYVTIPTAQCQYYFNIIILPARAFAKFSFVRNTMYIRETRDMI